MLTVTNLSHNFGSYWALKNCSFSLKKGEFLFLTGSSGAGKTSLLRLLYASLPVMRGNVNVAGYDLKDLPARQIPNLRREVSVVFQDFKILPYRTVFENVAMALEVRGLNRVHIERRVRAVVRGLGLEPRINMLCGELSGGEQQRVAVARSIVVNPKILLADEPTGNLDEELAARMMGIFKQFHKHGTTVVLATHSSDLVRMHPRARQLRLENGKIVGANWSGAKLFSEAAEEVLS
ncbi:MAG: cell division ATP-binding protein FtsE [Desulfovibrionales bacterium]|nr:cell division ATP-binding protein FtsE [Desulfovibrionales bacterium]